MKMIKKIFLILIAIFITFGATSCSKKKDKIQSLSDLNSSQYKIVAAKDSAYVSIAKESFPKAKITTSVYEDDCINELINGDAFAYVVARNTIDSYIYSNYEHAELVYVFPDVLDKIDISVGLTKESKYKDLFNSFIAEMDNKGILDTMTHSWLVEKTGVMPEIAEPKKTDFSITIGTCGYLSPYSYVDKNGDLTGLDIEFIKRFALYANAQVTIVTMGFNELTESLATGKIDAVVSNYQITDERKEIIDFSDPYMTEEIVTCVLKSNVEKQEILTSVDDLNDCKYTVIAETGAYCAGVAESRFPNAEIAYNLLTVDCFLSVLEGKTDAYVIEQMTYQKARESNESIAKNLTMLGSPIDSTLLAVGIPKNRDSLKYQLDTFINQLKADGTLDDMVTRWINGDSHEMPDIPKPSNPTQTLTIGTCGTLNPWSYIADDGELVGFDVELIKRFALYANINTDVQVMSFDALIAGLETGKLDAVFSDLNITEERKKIISYSEPYFISNVIVCVNKNNVDLSSSILKETKLTDMEGKTFGLMDSTVYASEIRNNLESCTVKKYTDYDKLSEALNTGVIDALVTDKITAEYLSTTHQNFVITDNISSSSIRMGFVKDDGLVAKANTAIAQMKEDGTINEIITNWANGNAATKTDNTNNETNGVLRMLIVDRGDNQNSAISIQEYKKQLGNIVASKLNYDVVITIVEPDSVQKAIDNGLCDVVLDVGEAIEGLNYTDALAELDGVIVLSSIENGDEKTSILEKLQAGFIGTFVTENRWKLIVKGLFVTLDLTLASIIFGTLLGIILSFPKRSEKKIIRTIFEKMGNILSGTPIVVILMVMYYLIFANANLSPQFVARIGFALIFGNTCADTLNAGIAYVGKGQIEAAKVLGYNKWNCFTDILFPQAVRKMLSVYKGSCVEILKATAIVGYITIEDVTRVSDIIRGRTYDAFFPLITTAILYLVLVKIIVVVINAIDRKINNKETKEAK